MCPPPRVTVVIVTHNDITDVLHISLPALVGDTIPTWMDVIVVDNASREDARGILETRFPKVRLLEQQENLGFARAVNAGLRSSTPDTHVLLLNPDAVLSGAALVSLLDFLRQNPRIGAVAPRLCNPDGRIQDTARAFPTLWTAVVGRQSVFLKWFPNNPVSRHYLLDRTHTGSDPFRVDWVSSACMLLRREAIVDVGLLDEGFFVYWEDADWCHRAVNRGWEVYCVPIAHAVHRQGGSGVGGAKATLRFHRSALRYFTKYFSNAPVLRTLAAACLFARAVVCLLRARRTATYRRRSRGMRTSFQCQTAVGGSNGTEHEHQQL